MGPADEKSRPRHVEAGPGNLSDYRKRMVIG